MKSIFGRETEIKRVLSYIDENRSSGSLRFLRGRRRVGKSTLIQTIVAAANVTPDHLYFCFSGRLDETEHRVILRWRDLWCSIFSDSPLINYSRGRLNWELYWRQLAQECKNNKNRKLVLFIDEVQWIAKARSGFIGSFKEAWLYLESCHNLRIVLCGSSQKFFEKFTGGDETILRGMCTHSDIWIYEFSLTQLYKYYGKHFTLEETAFAKMAFGGVPYYWNQLPMGEPFMIAFNKAVFSQDSIFLKEIDELLRLEFNSSGCETVKKVLKNIGMHGMTKQNLILKSYLPETTLTDILEKLIDYKILYQKILLERPIKVNQRGSEYVMKDAFLNFYFSILSGLARKIRFNENTQLFSTILDSKRSLYIESFTGLAFERLVQNLLESESQHLEKIFSELSLTNCDYRVGVIRNKNIQIDLVITSETDRIHRLVECRWTSNQKLVAAAIEGLPNKLKVLPEYSPKNTKMAVITNHAITPKLRAHADKHGVILMGLDSLVERTK